MAIEKKRLYRSREDKVFAGVCGGLGEYLDIDPVLIRVAWVAMALIKGFGILLYLVWIFVVPLKPYVEQEVKRKRTGGLPGIIFGSALVILGFLFLAEEWRWVDLHLWGGWTWDYVFPVMLMGIGVWFLLRGREKRESSVAADSAPPRKRRKKSVAQQFTRRQDDKKVFGVCGGIGLYLGIDSTVVRVLFVAVTLMNPPVGIITYLALAMFTPLDQESMGHPAKPQAS